MKIKEKLPLIISVTVLTAIIAFTGLKINSQKPVKTDKSVRTSSIKASNELRGVWVTYMDLDMEGTDRSYNSFKRKFNKIADTAEKKRFNTLIVQVRPFSDALYKSSYYPYSHIISGIQGKKPKYDPLKYMCYYTHKKGMKIHAWINPYRIRSSSKLKLSSDNPYKKDRSLGVMVDGGIYYNPALPKVRKLIENGITEIIKKYDVDGIQFDDYFYPTTSESFDSAQYERYRESVGADMAVSLKDWRIANVNVLIAECCSLIHNHRKDVVFGISPQGNIQNDYEICADVIAWCSKSGYVDYICPQLYYSLDNPALTFKDALKNWLSLDYSDDVTLYIGIAGYKTGTDSDGGTWNYSDSILQKEIELVRKKNLKGFMFYSYSNLTDKKAAREVSNLIKILD